MTALLHKAARRPRWRRPPLVTHRYVDFNAGAGGSGTKASPWDNLNDVTAPTTRDLIVHVTPLAAGAVKELASGTRFAPNATFSGKRVRFESATGGAIKINGVYPVIGNGMDGGLVELRDFQFDSAQQWLAYINSTTASFSITLRNSTVNITFPGLGLVRQAEAAPAGQQNFVIAGVTLTGATALLDTDTIGYLIVEGCTLPYSGGREWITGITSFSSEIVALIFDGVTITQTAVGTNSLLKTVAAGAPGLLYMRDVSITGEGIGDINAAIISIPDGVSAGTSELHLEDVTISMPTTTQGLLDLGGGATNDTRENIAAAMNGFGTVTLSGVNVTQTSTGRGVTIGVGLDGASITGCTWINRLDGDTHGSFLQADEVLFEGNRVKARSINLGWFGGDGTCRYNVFQATHGAAFIMGKYGGSSYDVSTNVGNAITYNVFVTGGEDEVDESPYAFTDYAWNVGAPADNTNVIDHNCYHAPNGGILAKIGAEGTECETLAEIQAAWAAQYPGQLAASNDAHSAVGGRLIVYAGSRACPHGVGYTHPFPTVGGSIVFTIENVSDADVNFADVSVPAGFTLVDLGDLAVAVGASTTLTIRLDAAASSGAVTISSDDSLLADYTFNVSG